MLGGFMGFFMTSLSAFIETLTAACKLSVNFCILESDEFKF
jgi:hypothetical protein